MNKVGITGQSGFIGTHIYNTLSLFNKEFEIVPFYDEFFENTSKLSHFVESCDTIVHLAAVNRHADPTIIYEMNISLIKKLIDALEKTKSKAHIIFSSSIQESLDNPYGLSKKEGRILLKNWAEKSGGRFDGLIIPNVYGPFGNPFYNSVVATFSHQVTHNITPKIEIDAQLKLIYVAELVQEFISKIRNKDKQQRISEFTVKHTVEIKVSEILQILVNFKRIYIDEKTVPALNNQFEINLFNTFLTYIDLPEYFPVKYKHHSDERGNFVEILRLNNGGQISFSTTKPGICRGNHFHTKKIERFAVIKGKALIELRRIGCEEVISFELNGEHPSFIDIPIWYTHNITNTGTEDLYTLFWINEFFDSKNPDTFFETV